MLHVIRSVTYEISGTCTCKRVELHVKELWLHVNEE